METVKKVCRNFNNCDHQTPSLFIGDSERIFTFEVSSVLVTFDVISNNDKMFVQYLHYLWLNMLVNN
jgi:hypothetical protein